MTKSGDFMSCLRLLFVTLPAFVLAGSCTFNTADSVAAITCGSTVSNAGVEGAAPSSPWTPRLYPVDPRGYYTVKSVQDNQAVPATRVTLSSLGLSPGDYVGLQAEGRYFFSTNGPETGSRLGAVFRRGSTMLHPGRFGDQADFPTWPTFYGQIPTNIPQDFEILSDREVIVRIPPGADRIDLSVGDSHYSDNRPAGAFGVRVFKPNKEGAPMSGYSDPPEDDAITALGLPAIDTTNAPKAQSFSPGPFSDRQEAATDPQWRGAYSTWRPADSRYAARRPGNRVHWGWDIFAPRGSRLIAPVWPSMMTFPEYSATYGNSVVFSFKRSGKVYHIAYSHLSGRTGPERYITGPEEVGFVGCSGNAEGPGCGARYANGTRNDHVHVGLFRTGPRPADRAACDPAGVLKWRMR